MSLEEKGLKEQSTLNEVETMLNNVAAALYPTHARRTNFVDTKENGSPLDLDRELNSKSHIADWPTFAR